MCAYGGFHRHRQGRSPLVMMTAVAANCGVADLGDVEDEHEESVGGRVENRQYSDQSGQVDVVVVVDVVEHRRRERRAERGQSDDNVGKKMNTGKWYSHKVTDNTLPNNPVIL